MKDLLLSLSVLAVIIYGFRLMKRLDRLLERVIPSSEDENCESR